MCTAPFGYLSCPDNTWAKRLSPFHKLAQVKFSGIINETSLFSIAGMKYHDQIQSGRKGFISVLTPHHSMLLMEVRARTLTGQEPGGKSWWPAKIWFAQPAFLFNSRAPAQGWHCPLWALPHQPFINKMPYMLPPRPVWWEHWVNVSPSS